MHLIVYFEGILNTNNDYFHIDISGIYVRGFGAWCPQKILKEWRNLVHFDVYLIINMASENVIRLTMLLLH